MGKFFIDELKGRVSTYWSAVTSKFYLDEIAAELG